MVKAWLGWGRGRETVEESQKTLCLVLDVSTVDVNILTLVMTHVVNIRMPYNGISFFFAFCFVTNLKKLHVYKHNY